MRHSILETDTAESVEMERVCFSLKTLKNGRLLCIPAPYLIEDDGKIELDLALKADSEAYTIANRVLSNNIDQAFLNSLFANDNFQSVSGSVTIRAIYSGTAVSYTPLHLIGAFKLTNPSLPEIHVGTLRESTFRLEHNMLFHPSQSLWDIFLAPSVFFYTRNFAYLDTDLLSTAVVHVNDLVQKYNSNGVDGDLALGMLSRRQFLPSLTVRVENIANEPKCTNNCQEHFFDIDREVQTRADVGMSVYVIHGIGQSVLGINAPFYGPFTQFDTLKSTVAYAYKLSKLECFLTFAPTIYTFGFLFDSTIYRLGITYSDEKQDNSIEIARQKQTYVFTSFFL